MTFVVIILLLVCIGLPLVYTARVWRLNEPSRFDWLIVAAEAVTFVTLVFLIGRWDIAGYYLRPILAVLFLASLIWSLRRHASRPWRSVGLWRRRWHDLLALAFFGATLIYVISGLRHSTEARTLAFPLLHERGFIGQGGGITLLNHHASHPEQRHALDITALNLTGFRATGPLPTRFEDYEIWGVPVISPCDGAVVISRSDLPDHVPPQADPKNPAGNHVTVDCGDFRVELAHLKRGSVAVRRGQRVKVAEPIGQVGNSGNTTEPHLHVHAYDENTRLGLPISFDGSTPFRNRVYTGNSSAIIR